MESFTINSCSDSSELYVMVESVEDFIDKVTGVNYMERSTIIGEMQIVIFPGIGTFCFRAMQAFPLCFQYSYECCIFIAISDEEFTEAIDRRVLELKSEIDGKLSRLKTCLKEKKNEVR